MIKKIIKIIISMLIASMLEGCFVGKKGIVINKSEKVMPKANKKIFAAIEKGDIEAVKFAIKKCSNVNVKDDGGRTALICAAQNGYIVIVRELLQAGAVAEVNTKDNEGNSALMYASERNYIETVTELLKAGADVNSKGSYLSTALIKASEKGHVGIVKELLKAGAITEVNAINIHGCTALMLASWKGHIETVKELLKAGADANSVDICSCVTVLMYASEAGCLEVVIELLKAGADVNASDKDEGTALMEASKNGYVEVAIKLLEAGAEVNVKDKAGNTALMYASEEGHLEVVRALLNAKADVNLRCGGKLAIIYVKCDVNKTALMEASEKGHAEIVKELLKAEADINAKDCYGRTALMYASEAGYVEIVKVLLSASTVWYTTGIAMGLLKAGTDAIASELAGVKRRAIGQVVEQQMHGKPVYLGKELFWAGSDLVTRGCKMLMRLPFRSLRTLGELLKTEIDVNAKDEDGNTALSLAKKMKKLAAVYQLIGGGAKEDQSFLDELITDQEAETIYTGARHKFVPIEILRKYCDYIAERVSVKEQAKIDNIVQKYLSNEKLGELICDIISNMSKEESGLNIDISLLMVLNDYIGYLNRKNAITLICQKVKNAAESPISLIDPSSIRCILSLTKISVKEIVDSLIRVKEEWRKSKRNIEELKGMKAELIMSELFSEKVKVSLYVDSLTKSIESASNVYKM